ncbi:Crp/Fnr family transcriptional regulator [Rhodohalobacter halophilus]|uniref:Crp/Fnr family transcriptional regulator n=1 Tax=Rhodohalobacter halophilus TaxID=1812810 RepID=UPI00083F71ED|nr:Crp/Fnr family transcriptional regulator [Rhodohalobacter halophilus]
MYEQLYNSIHEHVTLSEEEWELCKASFIPKRMRKRQFLLQSGDVCRRLAFIEKGALFSYSLDENGNQNVIQFGFEGWWIADLYSFLTDEPSELNIEVLEESELLMIDRDQNNELMEKVPAFANYNRILFQNAFVALQRRIKNTIGLSAEEKYTRFLEDYPQTKERVPQHLIASFLGMTPETLSRVRRSLTKS